MMGLGWRHCYDSVHGVEKSQEELTRREIGMEVNGAARQRCRGRRGRRQQLDEQAELVEEAASQQEEVPAHRYRKRQGD